jgi:hypothetical protein
MRIEILEGKVYLNGFSTKKLILEIIGVNPLISNVECANMVIALKKFRSANSVYRETTQKMGFPLSLSRITLASGTEVSPHYSTEIQNSVIHPSSNISFLPDITQKLEIAMPSAILPGAQNPGTVISFGARKTSVLMKTKLISKFEIDVITALNPNHFDLDEQVREYIAEQGEGLDKIFLQHLGVSPERGNALYSTIEIGCYDKDLRDISDFDIVEMVRKILG